MRKLENSRSKEWLKFVSVIDKWRALFKAPIFVLIDKLIFLSKIYTTALCFLPEIEVII